MILFKDELTSTTTTTTVSSTTNTTALITSTTPIMTTLAENKTALFNVALTINDQFTPDLLDNTSPAYLNLVCILKSIFNYNSILK